MILAFGLTILLSPLIFIGMRRWGVVDLPGERSSHSRPTPRGGGIAPAIGAATAAALSRSFVGPTRTATLLAACVIGAIGLAEDLVGVPALRRLALQGVAAVACLPLLFSGLEASWKWQAVFAAGAVLWLVSYVNAFNFMDGIHGLSVAQTVVAGLSWWAIGRVEDLPILGTGGLIVAAAALGFAPFNFPRPRMFLGDVGSYFLGAWLGALALFGLRFGLPPEAVVAPLSLYLADTAITLVCRIRRGEALLEPHRDHTYQRLIQLGWSHVRTTVLVSVVMVVVSGLGALSLVGSLPIRVAADLAILAVLAAYLLAPSRLAAGGGGASPVVGSA